MDLCFRQVYRFYEIFSLFFDLFNTLGDGFFLTGAECM